MKATMRFAMYPNAMNDEELKSKLVAAYIERDDSPDIRDLKGELYSRGYRWGEIVELAVVSLLCRHRYQQRTPSLN
jgi:hypothetical protein